MTHKFTIRAMLLSGVCLMPLGAMAADVAPAPAAPALTIDNEAVFGALGVGGSNTGVYGRYNGLTKQGLDLFGSFNMYARDAWDSGGAKYWQFTGDYLTLQTGNVLGTAQYPNGVNGQQRNFQDADYTRRALNNLGPNAELAFKVGEQGKWGVAGGYSATSYTGNIIDSIYTIRGTAGALNGPLSAWGVPIPGQPPLGSASTTNCPGNGLPGTATANSCALTAKNFDSAMRPYQMGTRRDAIGLSGAWEMENGWTLTGAVREEHKQGKLEETFAGGGAAPSTAAPTGSGNAKGGIAFALPVDFDSQRYDLQASYTSYDTQAVFSYFLSNFTDHDTAVQLPSPIAGVASATNTQLRQTANYGTPPSNWAQYLTANVAHNFTPDTRLNVNLRAGLEMQNSKFPANTADPAALATAGTGLNASGQGTGAFTSPNIVASVAQGNIGLRSNLFEDFTGGVKYSFDGRDVSMNNLCNTPAGTLQNGVNCVRGAGSGSDQIPAAGYPVAAYIVPVTWWRQKASLDFDYKPIKGDSAKVIGNFEFQDNRNQNMQASHSWTENASLGLSKQFGNSVTTRVGGSFSNRSANLTYWRPWYNLMGAPTTFGVNNYWGMASIAYYQAPMTEVAATARADWSPAGPFSAGASFKFANDSYHPGAQGDTSVFGLASVLGGPITTPLTAAQRDQVTLANGQLGGITQNNMATIGLNASYRVNDAFSLYGFYTYQRIFFNNRGDGLCSSVTAVNAAANNPASPCYGTAGYFSNKYTNQANTFGAAAEWQATDRIKLTLNDTFSITGTAFNQYNGVMVATPAAGTFLTTNQNVQSYPSNSTTLNDLRATFSYAFNENTELSLLGGWSLFKMTNWQNNGCATIAWQGKPAASPGVTGANGTGGGVCASKAIAGASAAVLQPGYLSPSYNVAMIGAALRIKW